MIHVEELTDKLIDCIFSLHLYIHSYEEGQEEDDTTGESHQLTGGQLRVGTDARMNVSVLFKTEYGNYGAGNHDGYGSHEHGVEHLVLAGTGGDQPVTDHKLLMPNILILTKFTTRRI